MDNPEEVARLNMKFVEELKRNAESLASRVGSLALGEEENKPLYPASAYEQMVSMYVNLKAMVLLVDHALMEGNIEKENGTEYLLINPADFIRITECSQMSIATYDSLQTAYNINLTLH